MKIKILLTILLISWMTIYAEVITIEEKQLFNQMLQKNELDSTSLNFLKDWASDTQFKLPIILDILSQPMKFPSFVDNIETTIENQNPGDILTKFSDILFTNSIKMNLSDNENTYICDIFKEYFMMEVKKPRDIFSYVSYVWETADLHYRKAWESITFDEKTQLEYLSLTLWQEEQDSLKYKKYYNENEIIEYPDLEIDDLIPVLKKIDFQSFMKSALIFQTGLDVLKRNINYKEFKWKKKLEINTRWGRFCIGTDKDDKYNQSYSFVLDPGGNDTYRMAIQTDLNKPYYWIVDLSGDDHYVNHKIGGLFRVIFGMGAHLDIDGDDVYQGGDFCLSSFFGYHLGRDMNGNDIYSGGMHSLGASTFGISILLDEAGNDVYSVTEFGEGFGGTLGAGLLIDIIGNDLYYAGGKYLHDPLAPFDYRTLSQGFGFGVRPVMGGGIGIIYDGEGNDYYNGGVYAQAVAYWYALGIIIDRKGNDFYTAVYYPQGSGIHLAGGFLLDEEGEDHYYSKHGPGQGAGHDYAVGFLVDRAGNDIYSVEGGNGLGLTNSVGIFLDVSGDDRYERNSESSYGYANIARYSGGIGIFLDTNGNDFYPSDSLKNNYFWQRGTYGFGLDTLFFKESIESIEEIAEEKASDIDSLADIETIFEIASEWEVGSSKKRVSKARQILLNREKESALYIYENKMDTKSSLEYRAIKEFLKNSEEFRNYIPLALHNSDSLVAKNAIRFIGELADTSYIDSLKILITQNRYIPTVLSTLGKMKSDKSTAILQDFITSPSERLRVITARGLKQIDTELSRQLLISMKNDPSFLIRTMVRLIKKFD